MPNSKENQPVKKFSTEPTPGFLQRIFGSSQMTPEMKEGIRIAQQENPNLAPVQPYGFFSRMMQPSALGYTSPGRTIYLNPATNAGQSAQDVADTITHEQTHVNQMQDRGHSAVGELLSTMFGEKLPYNQRPDEMEAFQSETARRAKMGRMQTAIPQFSKPEFYVPQDYNLPPEKGIKVGRR